MVHALKEAWRVLMPRGNLIDLRPLCSAAPLEIVSTGGSETAGQLDMSLSINNEIAADNAVKTVVSRGIIKELELKSFNVAYYWNTVAEMKADIEDRWRDVNLSQEIPQQAETLYNAQTSEAHVCLHVTMKLALFEKQL